MKAAGKTAYRFEEECESNTKGLISDMERSFRTARIKAGCVRKAMIDVKKRLQIEGENDDGQDPEAKQATASLLV